MPNFYADGAEDCTLLNQSLQKSLCPFTQPAKSFLPHLEPVLYPPHFSLLNNLSCLSISPKNNGYNEKKRKPKKKKNYARISSTNRPLNICVLVRCVTRIYYCNYIPTLLLLVMLGRESFVARQSRSRLRLIGFVFFLFSFHFFFF